MAESKKIIIVGIPGVGKSTLVSRVVSLLNSHNKSVNVVSFGTIMLDNASQYDIANRDQLRKLTVDKQQLLQKIAGEKIATMTQDVVIIDTHAFISTPSGFYPGLPYYVLKIIKPDFFVSVSARPEEIYSRRSNDETRSRDAAAIDIIKKELAVSESMVSTCCVLSGSPMKSILNTEGNIDEAAQDIINSIGL